MARQNWIHAEHATHGSNGINNQHESTSLVVLRRENGVTHLAARCGHCGGMGCHSDYEVDPCTMCGGEGWFGIDPTQRTDAQPGSVAKTAVLASRYHNGVSLWNAKDGLPEPRNGNAGCAPEDEVNGFIGSIRRGGALLSA